MDTGTGVRNDWNDLEIAVRTHDPAVRLNFAICLLATSELSKSLCDSARRALGPPTTPIRFVAPLLQLSKRKGGEAVSISRA